MHKAIYDSMFFIEFFYSKDENLRRKTKEEKGRKEKYVSAVTLHEVYKLSLAREGREVATLRAT